MSKLSGFSTTIISNSAGCFVKPTDVVDISNQLTNCTDLMAPVSVWLEPSGKGQTGLRRQELRVGEVEEMGSVYFPVCLFVSLEDVKHLQRSRAVPGEAWHGYFYSLQTG